MTENRPQHYSSSTLAATKCDLQQGRLSLPLSLLLSQCSGSCCLRLCGLTTATAYGKNLSSSSNTSTHLIAIFICIGICICIMFTILRFGRHCSLINHYGIHMWLKRSLTAFQRIFWRFQVEGCSTDRDCVLRSLYMDLVHSLHFEFQFFMDAEEICVYYHYFCCVFFLLFSFCFFFFIVFVPLPEFQSFRTARSIRQSVSFLVS